MTDEKKETNTKENIEHELLFDADAPFSIKTPVRVGSSKVVTHTLKPYNAGHIDLFERQGNNQVVLNSRAEVKTDATSREKAFIYLYDLLAESTDFYIGKDWLKRVPIMQKIAVAEALMKNYTLNEEEVKAKFGSQYVQEAIDNNVIYLLSRNGDMFYLSTHILREPDFEDISEYKRIKTSSETRAKKNKVTITPQLTYRRYAGLYDSLLVEAKGYVDNDPEKIPTMHKVGTVMELFTLIDEGIDVVQGN